MKFKLQPLVTGIQKNVGVYLMPGDKERLARICKVRGTNPHRELRNYVAQLFERYPDI
jgi:hypothetical protein